MAGPLSDSCDNKYLPIFRLQFEREEGSLEQFEDAEAKIKIRMEKVYIEREKLV
jgi:hypothetical protein